MKIEPCAAKSLPHIRPHRVGMELALSPRGGHCIAFERLLTLRRSSVPERCQEEAYNKYYYTVVHVLSSKGIER